MSSTHKGRSKNHNIESSVVSVREIGQNFNVTCEYKDTRTRSSVTGRLFSGNKATGAKLTRHKGIRSVDARGLHNPESMALAKGNTGHYAPLAQKVLMSAEAQKIVEQVMDYLGQGYAVVVICTHGMHRSVACGENASARSGIKIHHLDLRNAVIARNGVWPLTSEGSYTFVPSSSIASSSALSMGHKTQAEIVLSKNGVTLLKGYVLHVGGFEFGPFERDVPLCRAEARDEDGGTISEMTLPESVSDLASDYLREWGFRDQCYRITRPIKGSVDNHISNRMPGFKASDSDSTACAVLKSSWENASKGELTHVLSGTLPWAPTSAQTRDWLKSQIPSLHVFQEVHEGNEHIAQREQEQLASALTDGPYMALVAADTQRVLLGRWCMKLMGLVAPELLSRARGFRRSLFASLDGRGGLLLVTTERRLKAFLYGRVRQCPECDGLAQELIELLDGTKPWRQWKLILEAIERRSDKLDRPFANVRQQWQAFHRVLQATSIGLDLVDSDHLRDSLLEARVAFISQFVNDGNIASAEFKALADLALSDSLRGTAALDDNVLISRLGRAAETDPRIILHKEEIDRKKAESFYQEHPYGEFIQEVEKACGEAGVDSPYDIFLKDILHRAWGIPKKELPDMLAQKEKIEQSGICRGSPWADSDGNLLEFAPSTRSGFGLTLKRTATLRFSRKMGGIAREAVMMVQADLGDDEPTPSYMRESTISARGFFKNRLSKQLAETKEFQKRLHKVCLCSSKHMLEHCRTCVDPNCPEEHLHRTTIFDAIFPERENKPRSFDLQPAEFSVLTEAVEPLMRAVIDLYHEQNEAYHGFRNSIMQDINALLQKSGGRNPLDLIAESFDASVSTDMLEFQHLHRLWDVIFTAIPAHWLNVDFPGAYPGWQKDVAYAAASPRVQRLGKMVSNRVPGFGDLAIEKMCEAPDLSEVSTFHVEKHEELLRIRPPRIMSGGGWSPCPMVGIDEPDIETGLSGFAFLRHMAQVRSQYAEDKDAYLAEVDQILTDCEKLPINQIAGDVVEAVNKDGICVISASTGTGKTTLLPLLLRTERHAKYVVTQPRRLAADGVCGRCNEEGAIAKAIHKDNRFPLLLQTPPILKTLSGKSCRNRPRLLNPIPN